MSVAIRQQKSLLLGMIKQLVGAFRRGLAGFPVDAAALGALKHKVPLAGRPASDFCPKAGLGLTTRTLIGHCFPRRLHNRRQALEFLCACRFAILR